MYSNEIMAALVLMGLKVEQLTVNDRRWDETV
jgi:hypothetical protein